MCVLPAPLCPYAMTVALTPRTHTSSSAGARHARATSSLLARASKTASKAKAVVVACCEEEELEEEGDGAVTTRISRESTRASTGEGAPPAPAASRDGRTRHTTRVSPEPLIARAGVTTPRPALS